MITIKVADMSCMHCVKAIGEALSSKGIEHEINLESKTVKVEQDKVDLALLALQDADYEGVVL